MNNTSLMDIASRIRLERQKRSWTQEQLAERAGLATRTVQRIEAGADASPETIRLVAETFGIAPGELAPRLARIHFGAPADLFVKLVTGIIIALDAALFVADGIFHIHLVGNTGLLILAVVFLAGFFTVSGYSVRDGMLTIHRFGWAKRFDLARLGGVEVNPLAMTGAIRLFGVGGLFAYVGWFRNSMLGRFRAYATNRAHSVVLDFGGKKIVVTPDDPEAFADAVREAAKGSCAKNGTSD